MGSGEWTAFADRHRREMTLFALVSAFAGVALAIDRPKGTIIGWLAIPFLVAGAALFAWAAWPRGIAPAEAGPSLAWKLLRRITWRGRLVPYFPAIGAAILALDVAYNLLVASTATFGTEDTIALLAAGTLIGYGFVPARFARERDFVFVFIITLNVILVVPLLIARAFYADFERSVDVYSWVALAPQTSAILNLFGVANTVHPVVGSTAPGLTFQPQKVPFDVTVIITTACSGIYSFGIFASAFVAFVGTEYECLTRRVWALLGLGLLAAYVANVLRMVVIVLVGYYTDTTATDLQNMLVAHSYAGWLIFLGWIALFWSGVFKLVPRDAGIAEYERVDEPSWRSESRCQICSDPLTALVPATRCECGAYLHRLCLSTAERCPSCGQQWKPDFALALRGS